jgi:hypothetical protein
MPCRGDCSIADQIGWTTYYGAGDAIADARTQFSQMQVRPRFAAGTRPSNSVLIVTFEHQQGTSKRPHCAGAQAFGPPHRGQISPVRGGVSETNFVSQEFGMDNLGKGNGKVSSIICSLRPSSKSDPDCIRLRTSPNDAGSVPDSPATVAIFMNTEAAC